ncbi:MAG: succinate dehydrogenase iron-sulfur subunit [bacterium JZ-2024 1]
MRVALRIKRFLPEKSPQPYYQTYEVEVEPVDRVLDALHSAKDQDGSLSFRRSCGHGICGSDAMKINGRNRLACKVLIRDLRQPIVIEPLPGFRVIKDLVVDFEPFFARYRSILPYLVERDEPPQKERYQSPQDRQKFDDSTKCILCGACTSSCPSFWARGEYIGPAMMVQAHRFIFDSRDGAREQRLRRMADTMGLWRCRSIFNCVEACPREINITRAIAEIKNELLKSSF